jgi:hypothetical protein
VQSVQADVAGYDDVAETVRPYADVACDDMAVFDWQMWSNYDVTRGIILVNGVVPRGPVMGCHGTIGLLVQNFMYSMGFEPWTSPIVQSLGKSCPANAPTHCYLPYNNLHLI